MLKKNRLLSCLLLLFATVIAGCNGSVTPPDAQTPTSQTDCDALVPTPNPTCIKYTFEDRECKKTQDSCPVPQDECTDSTTCPTDKPICKDDGGVKKCLVAADQTDCDALAPAPNPTCIQYTFDSGTCKKTQDSCPTPMDKCADATTCPTGQVCTKDPSGIKICQPPKNDADCKMYANQVKAPFCTSYTFFPKTAHHPATCGKTYAGLKDGDNCCPGIGYYSDADSDCPTDTAKLCTDSTSCKNGEVCTPDSHGKKICQPPKNDADCDTLVPTPNPTCIKYAFDSGACKQTQNSCPVPQDECADSSTCPTDKPICKDDGGVKKCQVAADQTECDALVPTPNPTCIEYTFDSGACKKTQDSCPVPQDECADSTTCPTEKPICKDDGGVKKCQVPADQTDCETYAKEVKPPACTSYTFSPKTAHRPAVCGKTYITQTINDDGCCPGIGYHSDVDNDCPKKT